MTTNPPPPAYGTRLPWTDLPARVRGDFEAWAGSPVVSAETQAGGFSPGVAARVRLADGRGLFVKAISAAQNPDTPRMHRREASIAQALPAATPAPRLLWFYDQDGWVLLVFEEAPGHMPVQPWLPDELERVIDALDRLVDALTPSPLPPEFAASARQHVESGIHGWGLLRAGTAEQRAGLDAWTLRHLDELAELEQHAQAAVEGSTLLHFDVRADNILLNPRQVWFVDWPHVCVGAPWVDVVAFAPNVRLNGGPPPEEILQHSRHGRAADPLAVTAFAAALCGYFTYRATLPPPPGLPTLRAFQAAHGVVMLDWLKRRISEFR